MKLISWCLNYKIYYLIFTISVNDHVICLAKFENNCLQSKESVKIFHCTFTSETTFEMISTVSRCPYLLHEYCGVLSIFVSNIKNLLKYLVKISHLRPFSR